MSVSEFTATLEKAKDVIIFAQGLPPSPIYDLNDIKDTAGVSTKTVRRRIMRLKELGLADYYRGKFTVKREVISQPYLVLQSLVDSLLSLKKARRFGRHYGPADINFARKHIPDDSIITLDYRAYELTGFQMPLDLYVYVDDVEDVAKTLKGHRFREGQRGNVVLLPKIGINGGSTERVFLDCVANGGRSFLDAAAIMLTCRDKIKTKVMFTGDTILKVQEDLPNDAIG